MTDPRACMGELIEKISVRSTSGAFVSSFFYSCASRAELFFGLHLPAWPSDSCSVCQLVVSGTVRRVCWVEKKKKKREGSSRVSANTSGSPVRPYCPSAQQGKRLSLLINVLLLFSVKWALFICGPLVLLQSSPFIS